MKVQIPAALLSYTGHFEVEAEGVTIGELFTDLDRRFPGLRFRVIDEQDRFRRHIRCFINGRQSFDLGQPLTERDDVVLVQALSGG
jgi:molybdopterin converting factor small subunit